LGKKRVLDAIISCSNLAGEREREVWVCHWILNVHGVSGNGSGSLHGHGIHGYGGSS